MESQLLIDNQSRPVVHAGRQVDAAAAECGHDLVRVGVHRDPLWLRAGGLRATSVVLWRARQFTGAPAAKLPG